MGIVGGRNARVFWIMAERVFCFSVGVLSMWEGIYGSFPYLVFIYFVWIKFSIRVKSCGLQLLNFKTKKALCSWKKLNDLKHVFCSFFNSLYGKKLQWKALIKYLQSKSKVSRAKKANKINHPITHHPYRSETTHPWTDLLKVFSILLSQDLDIVCK